MSIFTKYALSGILAGSLTGFLGAGGGIVLVPLLSWWIKLKSPSAFATSVFIIFPVCAVSAFMYFIYGRLHIQLAMPYLIGGVVGGIICGRLFQRLPVIWLRRLFALVLILGGLRSLLL